MRSPSLFWRTLLLVLLLIVASLGHGCEYRLERGRARKRLRNSLSVSHHARRAGLCSPVRAQRLLAGSLTKAYALSLERTTNQAASDGPLIKLMAGSSRLGAIRARSEVMESPAVSPFERRDEYWVYITLDPVAHLRHACIGWAAIALLLSVIGAMRSRS